MIKRNEKRETLLNVGAEDFVQQICRNDPKLSVNPFILSLAVAKRARQLVGAKLERRMNGENPAELYYNFWPLAEACDEIYDRKVKIVSAVERGRSEDNS